MTPERIKAIAGNFIGHLTTDPEVREKIEAVDADAAGAHEAFADIINAATAAQPPIEAADIPAISAAIRQIAQTHATAPLPQTQTSNIFLFLRLE